MMKVRAAPRLASQRLMNRYPRGLKLCVKAIHVIDRDRGRQQHLAVPDRGVDDRRVDVPKIEPGGIARHLGVEGWIAIHERDGKPELRGKEVARRRDVGDEQLRLGGSKDGSGRRPVWAGAHGFRSGACRSAYFARKRLQ
jgi:hypothetical protein